MRQTCSRSKSVTQSRNTTKSAGNSNDLTMPNRAKIDPLMSNFTSVNLASKNDTAAPGVRSGT
jgi:hypothetical protein